MRLNYCGFTLSLIRVYLVIIIAVCYKMNDTFSEWDNGRHYLRYKSQNGHTTFYETIHSYTKRQFHIIITLILIHKFYDKKFTVHLFLHHKTRNDHFILHFNTFRYINSTRTDKHRFLCVHKLNLLTSTREFRNKLIVYYTLFTINLIWSESHKHTHKISKQNNIS